MKARPGQPVADWAIQATKTMTQKQTGQVQYLFVTSFHKDSIQETVTLHPPGYSVANFTPHLIGGYIHQWLLGGTFGTHNHSCFHLLSCFLKTQSTMSLQNNLCISFWCVKTKLRSVTMVGSICYQTPNTHKWTFCLCISLLRSVFRMCHWNVCVKVKVLSTFVTIV